MLQGKYVKTSQYAKEYNMKRATVTKHFHDGLIPGYQNPKTGTIYLENPELSKIRNRKRVILYARVSSTTNKASLDGQIQRMRDYAAAKGYNIVDEVKEIASGLNDNRRKLNKIFKRNDYDILLCEHEDRLTRFGYKYIKALFARDGIQVEAINQMENTDDEMMHDFISIVTSFCHRVYGRNCKKKTEAVINEIRKEAK